MELQIGPYTLLKRTEYSKFQVLDKLGNNINETTDGKALSEKNS